MTEPTSTTASAFVAAASAFTLTALGVAGSGKAGVVIITEFVLTAV